MLLLDFSAAFDTIDHKILISRLENRFGVAGIPLSWFQSYLQSRTQYVKVNGKASASTPLQQGVPQGSVLGPLLFSLYAAPLEDILTAHGVDGMIFADDTQLYITLKESNTSTTVHQLECCVHDIRYWCISNKLFLNVSKTELLHIFSSYARSDPLSPFITFGDIVVSSKTAVRDLGAVLDEKLTMRNHINIDQTIILNVQ